MKQERRKFIRFDVPLKAGISVHVDAGTIHSCGTKDFSREGLRLVIHGLALPQGSNVEINVYLPDNSDPVLVKGKVVWSKNDKGKLEAGLNIEAIDKGRKSDVLDYVYAKWRKKNSRNSKWISPPD